MRRLTTILGLFSVTVLLAAACGLGDSSDQDASGESTDAAGDAGAAETNGFAVARGDELTADTGGGDAAASAAQSDPADPATGDAPSVAAPPPVLDGRSIIFTATMSVAVEDVMVATAEAQALLDSIGLLFGQEATGGDQATAILTFKVRPDQFDTALSRLAGLGEVLSQTRTTDDVTEAVVDLSLIHI